MVRRSILGKVVEVGAFVGSEDLSTTLNSTEVVSEVLGLVWFWLVVAYLVVSGLGNEIRVYKPSLSSFVICINCVSNH